MTIEQLKEIIINQEQELLNQGKNLVEEYTNGWKPDASPAWLQPIPKPSYVDYEAIKKTRFAPPRTRGDYDNAANSLQEYIDKHKNNKSQFEHIIDALFTPEEKIDYLLSIGYRKLEGSSYLVKGEPDPEFKRTFTVDEAFLTEITIKFKNVLLSKGTLKLKF